MDKAKNIDVGETYSNWKSATTFMEYISEAKTKVTDLEVVKNAKFYSLSMDGRTDEGCVEQKTLFVVTRVNGHTSSLHWGTLLNLCYRSACICVGQSQ